MITVIATGFDGRAARTRTGPAAASASRPTRVRPAAAAAAARRRRAPVPARDFLEELERQRTEIDPDVPRVAGRRPSRSAPSPLGRRAAARRRPRAYDADDLEIPSFLRRR